ncbi:MAG: hypothetical protein L6R28_09015 [Planctomycetes bacterium]|nr:hypothetical protein [Planctomycetota bacterium]
MRPHRFLPRPAFLGGRVPELHQTGGRVLIETLGEWRVLGANRRAAGYAEAFATSSTPVQLARWTEDDTFVSLVTPCAQTGGKFELYAGGRVRRLCCCACAQRKLAALDERLALPPPGQWLVYLLMESAGWLCNPGAPVELGKA